jgi:membrane protease YdiL (CAAX protease family)
MPEISRKHKIGAVVGVLVGLLAAAGFNLIKDRPGPWVIVRALEECTFAGLVLLAFVCFASSIVRSVLFQWKGKSPKSAVTALVAGSVIGQISTLFFFQFYWRNPGVSLDNLGLLRTSPGVGWLVALIGAGIYSCVAVALPPRAPVKFRELMPLHIFNCFLTGTVAAFCEEVIFRGFMMNRLAQADLSPTLQVLFSSLLFGLGHIVVVPGEIKPYFRLAVGIVAWKSVLGCLFGLAYILSERSLKPVILAHALLNAITGPSFLSSLYGYETQKGLDQAS